MLTWKLPVLSVLSRRAFPTGSGIHMDSLTLTDDGIEADELISIQEVLLWH